MKADGHLRELTFVKYRKILTDGGIIVMTCGLFILAWTIVNGDYGRQEFFLRYILMSHERLNAGVSAWCLSRLQSLANTVVPLYLYFVTGDAQEVNSLYGRVPGVIPFIFQYWNTVPFGFGLIGSGFIIKQAYKGAREHPLVFTWVIALPFFGFAIYWGFNITGLMPEGLHVWVMSVILFIAWIWQRPLVVTRSQALLLSLRGIEVLAMLIAPLWLSVDKRLDEVYYINDIIMLCVMFGGTAILARKTLEISSYRI
jgi:hypothetical protein